MIDVHNNSNIESQKSSYDAFACHYRAYSENKQLYIDAVDNIIVKKMNVIESIFDFGAGDGVRGVSLKSALQAHYLVQGDISRQMLSACNRHNQTDIIVDTSQSNWWLNLEKFDLILALWNVMGHIPAYHARVNTLIKLKELLSPQGYLIFDVNNRHNDHYGRATSICRRIYDRLLPDYSRGDAHFEWCIDGNSYPAYGHLFTLKEVKQLLMDTGFCHYEWLAVDYHNGHISQRVNKGQLLFICQI